MNTPPPLQPPARSPQEILAGVELPDTPGPHSQDGPSNQPQRVMLQEFRPLVDSLEWELSGLYWQTHGLRPFVEKDVPFEVNNSGWAAENAAAVLLASCREADSLPENIQVVELGAGLGLFARQLLDAFKRLCEEHSHDYYQRLTYYVTDGSAKTIEQWREKGVFTEHGPHAVLARCDACRPTEALVENGKRVALTEIQAVFANYVLDSLPATVLRRHNGQTEQLCARAYVNTIHEDAITRQTGLTIPQAVAAAGSAKPDDKLRLMSILSYLEFEAAFQPIDGPPPPYCNDLLAQTNDGARTMLNYGAIGSLEVCLERLNPTGFVLINDYGPTQAKQAADLSYAQRFGASLAVCVHFPFMEHHFKSQGRVVLTPNGDEQRTIHSRLISAKPFEETARVFIEKCSDDRFIEADRMSVTATQHTNAGRLGEALKCYQKALSYCPSDWHLLGQAAEFLTQQLHRYEESLELALAAVAINPWYSTFLWNTLGNCYFCLGRFDEAHEAYETAQAINAADAQTQLNLAFSYTQRSDHTKALAAIARGLEHDTDGRFRSVLLAKQQQVMDAIANRQTAREQRDTQRYTVFSTAR